MSPHGDNSAKQSSARDSDAMRARILEAVGRMIVRDGLAAIGVNALAREAGCDKVLIYRYFGDLEGVYAALRRAERFLVERRRADARDRPLADAGGAKR